MPICRYHRTRPGMLKLNPTLRLMKTYCGTVSSQFDRTNTKISHTPHLMQYHLCIFSLQSPFSVYQPAYGNRRNIKNLILFVHTANAVHLLKILYITGTDSFLPIHP